MKNTPIRVISPNFDFLGEIDDYESLIFIRRHFKVGDFELRININNNTDILQEDNIILLGQDGKKAGIIRHREIALDESGEDGEILLIRGYTLKGVISRRRIVPPTGQGYDTQEGSTEYIMKQFVNNNFVNPIDIERRIPQVAIAPNLNRGQQDKWRGSFEVVSDKLEEIGEYSQIGWDVFLDINNKKWIFDVVVGRDLTVNQSTLPPVIFSVDFDNIKGQSYIDSAINHANVAYAGGQGEEENRLIQQIGNATGFERIETFLDCSSAEDVTELIEEGNRGLEELKKIKTFESQVLDFGSFIYGQDWDLGDIVSTQNKKWNLTMDTRIVEVKEIYEENGFNLELVFGNTVPDFMDKVKKIEKKQILSTGKTGEPGVDGVGIQYSWNGTELGVKREDEIEYQYINLVGPQGPIGPEGPQGKQGIQGIPGLNGKSLEFHWNGTQLGIRVEGQVEYQYVNLKGKKGDQGIQGPQGIQGERGLQGIQGIQGEIGPMGPSGKNLEFIWNGTQLGIRQEGQSVYQYVNLKGDTGAQGEQGIQGPKGDVGPQGPKGNDGYTPVKGVDYFDGAKGDKGDTGPMGPVGPKGDTGPRGLEGPQGPAGEDGSDAEVTKENVINAIGYTPAKDEHEHTKSEITDFPTEMTPEYTAIPSNADLNDYTEIGFYGTASSGVGSTVLNKPTEATGFTLIVAKRGSYTTQILIDWILYSPYMWIRSWSRSWGNWYKVPFDGDIPTKLSQLAKDINFDERYYTKSETYTKTEVNTKLDEKVDKVTGKQLSTEDFTTTEKNKLANIEDGAEKNKVNSINSKTGDIVIDKTEVGLSNVQNYGIASQIQAELGTLNNRYMTPLRTKQAIDKAIVNSGGTKIITSATEPSGLKVGDQWHRTY